MAPSVFWNYVGGVDLVESYDSLESIIDAADLIVVAEVVGFDDGRRIEFPETGETMYMAEVRARATRALKGTPVTPSGEADTIVVEMSYGFSPNPAMMASLDASTPAGSRVVLFLANKAADGKRHSAPPDAPYLGPPYLYLLLRGDQAAIRDEGGIARIGPGESTPAWVADLDGRPFDEVIREIEDAIAAR